MKTYIGATVLAAAAIGAIAASAGAQSAAAPAPCTGFVATDPKGDQIAYPNPGVGLGATAAAGPDTVDIRGLFFNYKKGADGKPALTANVQLTNLDTAIPAGAASDAVTYFVDFAPAVGDVSWVEGKNDGGTFGFTYGKVQRAPDGTGTIAVETATTGNVYPGPNGIVEIAVPLDASGAKTGTKMEGIYASSAYDYYAPSDDAPDEDLKTYTVTDCPEGAGTPTSGPAPDPGTSPGPAPGPAAPPANPSNPGAPGQAGPGSPPAGTLPASGKLTVSFAADKGKRSTARKRGLRVRVSCSVQCNAAATASVTAKVARKLGLGKKALRIASGSARIDKAGRIPFYLKLTGKAKKAIAKRKVKKFSLTVTAAVTDRRDQQRQVFKKKSTLR